MRGIKENLMFAEILNLPLERLECMTMEDINEEIAKQMMKEKLRIERTETGKLSMYRSDKF